MDIEERFEELNRKVESVLLKSEGIPVEVLEILEDIKQTLINKSVEQGINFSSITEYIEGQFETFKASIVDRIGENRRNKKIEDCIYDINFAKERLEKSINSQILEERKKEDRREANTTTAKILNEMEYVLNDIYSHQIEILAARDFDEKTVEDIMHDIKAYMRYFTNKSEDKMVYTFDEDNEKTRKFEESIMEELLKVKEESLTNRERFEEELKSGAPTLEEQKEDAGERKSIGSEELKGKENRSLPDNVLE